jgi:hypothetical protein
LNKGDVLFGFSGSRVPRDVAFVQPAADFQRVLASVPVRENASSALTLIFDWVGALGKK